MVSMGIHIGYNILHMPLVRFYVDYFDGFGKLRDIYCLGLFMTSLGQFGAISATLIANLESIMNSFQSQNLLLKHPLGVQNSQECPEM